MLVVGELLKGVAIVHFVLNVQYSRYDSYRAFNL